MSEVSGEERLARAALTYVAEPGDHIMGALLRTCTPAEIVTALIHGRAPISGAIPDGFRRRRACIGERRAGGGRRRAGRASPARHARPVRLVWHAQA